MRGKGLIGGREGYCSILQVEGSFSRGKVRDDRLGRRLGEDHLGLGHGCLCISMAFSYMYRRSVCCLFLICLFVEFRRDVMIVVTHHQPCLNLSEE